MTNLRLFNDIFKTGVSLAVLKQLPLPDQNFTTAPPPPWTLPKLQSQIFKALTRKTVNFPLGVGQSTDQDLYFEGSSVFLTS